MTNWADELIAQPMGFQFCVLFPRAREAIKAWSDITRRPIKLLTNICPVAKEWATFWTLHPVDDFGMAPGITTQLYGYRERGVGTSELDLDPLMTGYFDRPCATSSIISFGRHKTINVGAGAAFLTQDQGLSEEMDKLGYFPAGLAHLLSVQLLAMPSLMQKRFEKVAIWDRHLGDSLQRMKREQIVPWRVMRLSWTGRARRDAIVEALRNAGHDVGINYPPLDGCERNYFGDRVLNFFLSDDYDEPRIKDACEIIKRTTE